jgi:DNA-binding transcriptional ArsR family regulator
MPFLRYLDDILGGRAKVAVLRVLFREDGLGGREIARKAGLSPRSAHAALKELVGLGILTRKVVGNNHVFTANRAHIAVAHGGVERLFKQEQRLLSTLAEKVHGWIRGLSPVSLAVFGSVARGESRPGSDLDLLVILKEPRKISQARELLGRRGAGFHDLYGFHLAPYVVGAGEFAERYDRKDKLIRNMVKEGLVVWGKPLSEVLADES